MAGRCETSEVTYIVLGMNSAHSESAVSKGPAHEPKCGGRLSTAYVVLSTKTRFRGTVMAQNVDSTIGSTMRSGGDVRAKRACK
jgi:hypothetical protein